MTSPARAQELAWKQMGDSRQARPGKRALAKALSSSRALPRAASLPLPARAPALPSTPSKLLCCQAGLHSPLSSAQSPQAPEWDVGAGAGTQDELELLKQTSSLLGGAKQMVEALRAEVRDLEQRLAARDGEASAALSQSSRCAVQLSGVLRAIAEALGESEPDGASTDHALARLVEGVRRVVAARDAARSESRRLCDELAAHDRDRAAQRGFELAFQRSESDKRALIVECAALRGEAKLERAAAARERGQAIAALEAAHALVRAQSSEMAGAVAAADANAAERVGDQARQVSLLSAQVARLSAMLAAERDTSARASRAASEADARAAAAEAASRRAEAAVAQQAQQLSRALAAKRHHDLLIDVDAKVRAIRAQQQHGQPVHAQHAHQPDAAATIPPLSPAQRRAWRRT
jgi:hypothetical protein